MIAIVDNVLTDAQMYYCIEKFNQENLPTREYYGKLLIDNNEYLGDDQEFNNILSIINREALKFNPNLCIDWSHLNFWPKHSLQNLHYDNKSEETVFTSITYLNCSYRGGETFFEDGTTVAPVTGRTVFFDGMKYLHGVRPISHGTRVTLSVWYKQRI
jgi:hypothetical protein